MTDSATYLSQLHQLLNQHFNLAEIRTLCLDLNVDYESIAGEEKPSRIRELLLGLGRNGRLPELVAIAQQQRPLVEWPPVREDFELLESLMVGSAVPTNQYHIYGDLVQGDKIGGDKVMGDKHEHHHHHYSPKKKPPPPPRMALSPPDDFVQRPQEYEQLIAYLLADNKQNVAITATLQGAGGFGKTTLAQAICHDKRILDAFPDGILWTTIGDDRTNVVPGLQKLYQVLTGEEAKFVDEHDATVQLSAELNERRCLLVIDDVWNGVHLRPFLQGGQQCARLITTRIASVVPKETEVVAVDAMRQTEAVDLLGAGLDALDTAQLAALAGRLGKWPLLLKLVNRRLYEDVKRHGVPLPGAIATVNEELDEFGLTSFDADTAEERDLAVAASMSVSLRQLRPNAKYGRIQVDEAARFQELAILPEDAVIPVSVVALLWQETGQLSGKATEKLCRRLADLSLLLGYAQQTQTIQLHDVTRHYLIEQATNEQYKTWQERLLNSYETKCSGEWHRLPDDGYVYQNLLWHMREAGQQDQLEQLLLNYNWLDAKLQATDVLILISDFELRQDTTRHSQLGLLQHALQMSASVLARDKNQLTSQLYGRLSGLGEAWHPFVDTIQKQERTYWLQTQKPSLSPPGGNLIYTLSGHTDGVDNLLLTDDGRLISSCSNRYSNDHTVKVWDIKRGALLHNLEGHTAPVDKLLLAGDSRLISFCTRGKDLTVKVWDIERGTLLHSLEDHTYRVNNLLLTGDGRLLASYGGTVKVWDMERGVLLHSLEGHTYGPANLLLTGDGRLISSGYDHTVKVWDIETGALLHSLEDHSYWVNKLLLTGDDRLISSCSDHTMRVWDIERGTLLHSLEGHTNIVGNLLLTGDGRLISSCSNPLGNDHTVKVWDIETGALLHSLEGHTFRVSNLLLASDGRLLSSCGYDIGKNSSDHSVKVWDIKVGTLLHNLEGHTAGVDNLLLTSNGHIVSSCRYSDHTVKVWDIETGTLLHNLKGHTDGVSSLLLTGDGQIVSSCRYSDHTVKVWDIETGTLLHNLKGHTDGVSNLLLTGNGRLLSSCGNPGSNDPTVKVWDIERGTLLHSLEDHTYWVNDLLLTGDGHLLSSCGGWGSRDHTVKTWDIKTGTLSHTLKGHTGGVSNLLLTGDGRLISSCSYRDHTVKVWDIKTGTLLHTLKGHTDGVGNLLLASDGRFLFSCGSDSGMNSIDHSVKVWDIEAGTLLHNLEGHTTGVDNLLLTNDGRLISYCTYSDHTVKVWDIERGTLLHSLEGHTYGAAKLLLTGDGRLISSSRSERHNSDHTMRVWDIERGTLLHSLEGHTNGVSNLLLTGDGRLISSGGDHTVKVWHIETGALLHTLKGHTFRVSNLLLASDGRLLSSCGNDRDKNSIDHSVKVWNIETGTLLHNLEEHTDGVNNLLLTSNGHIVSSCTGHDPAVKVWDIETGNLLYSLECHILGIKFMTFLPMSDYLMTVDGTRLSIWQIDEGKQVACFTTDGGIQSYVVTPDDRIILGDRMGRVHFLKLVGPSVSKKRVCE